MSVLQNTVQHKVQIKKVHEPPPLPWDLKLEKCSYLFINLMKGTTFQQTCSAPPFLPLPGPPSSLHDSATPTPAHRYPKGRYLEPAISHFNQVKHPVSVNVS